MHRKRHIHIHRRMGNRARCLALLLAAPLSACAPGEETAPPGGRGPSEPSHESPADPAAPGAVERSTRELVSKSITCGNYEEFPTWSFWGWTTVEAVNHSPGTRVRLGYQSGTSATEEIEVENFAKWGGRWAGFTLYVTYLGFTGTDGVYRNCIQNAPPPADAPTMIVQTY
jgi:hypothetical protein